MTTSPEQPAEVRATEAAVPDDYRTVLLNRVSWGAVLAGVVTALVVQLLLNMLGIGIGLGTLSAAGGDNPSPTTLSVGAGLWWTLTGSVASFLGGALAGRLAGKPSASTGGWHGVVTWAATTLVIAYLLTTALGGVLGGAFSVLGNAASAVGRSAASAVPAVAQADPFAGIERQVRAATAGNDPAALRDSVVAYVRGTVTGDQAEAQAARGRAVDALAKAANVSPEEAGKRIDEWQQQYRQTAEQAERKARDAAETARQAVSRAGLFGFVALVLGAVAAWFGGSRATPEREATLVGRLTRRF